MNAVKVLMALMGFIAIGGSVAGQEPWLPQQENERLRKLIEARGVPVNDTLKFYSLDRVFQKMYSMPAGRGRSAPFNDVLLVAGTQADAEPWMTSGGMHHINRKHWRNVTGLDLGKDGRIRYYQEPTNVRAFVPVDKHRWSFPSGTVAYDVLIRLKDDGSDSHIFEVRTRTKGADGSWDAGDVYRPIINQDVVNSGQGWAYNWRFNSNYYSDIGTMEAQATVKEVATIDVYSKFKLAKRSEVVVDKNSAFTPPNYAGAGMSCTACHQHAGQVHTVFREIYLEPQAGDDTVHSWHPFDMQRGGLDRRWPLSN